MRPTKTSAQLTFPWISENRPQTPLPKRIRSRSSIQHLRWPPKAGERVWFNSEKGVESGIVRRIRFGIVWVDYVLEDGRVVLDSEMLMSDGNASWRDPDTVSEEERQACVARIQAVHAAGKDLTDDPEALSDLGQYQVYIAVKQNRERTQEAFALKLPDPQDFRPA